MNKNNLQKICQNGILVYLRKEHRKPSSTGRECLYEKDGRSFCFVFSGNWVWLFRDDDRELRMGGRRGQFWAITFQSRRRILSAPEPVYSGQHSLKLVDGGEETPEAYVAYITGLSNGDVITASFHVYDTTPGPGVSPRARIWAHYVKNNSIDDFAGSAGGNSSYSDGTGWCNLSWNWTVDLGYDRTGLVIEVRTYSNHGDTVWIDDLSITVPETAMVHMPGQTVP